MVESTCPLPERTEWSWLKVERAPAPSRASLHLGPPIAASLTTTKAEWWTREGARESGRASGGAMNSAPQSERQQTRTRVQTQLQWKDEKKAWGEKELRDAMGSAGR